MEKVHDFLYVNNGGCCDMTQSMQCQANIPVTLQGQTSVILHVNLRFWTPSHIQIQGVEKTLLKHVWHN